MVVTISENSKVARRYFLKTAKIVEAHVVSAFSARATGRYYRARPTDEQIPTHVTFESMEDALRWAERLRSTFRSFEINEYPTVLLECDIGFLLLVRPAYISPNRYANSLKVALRSARLAVWQSEKSAHLLNDAIIYRKQELADFSLCYENLVFYDRLSVLPQEAASGLGWRIVRNSSSAAKLIDIVVKCRPATSDTQTKRLTANPHALAEMQPPRPIGKSDAPLPIPEKIALTELQSPLHWSRDEQIPIRLAPNEPQGDTTREQLSMARVGQGIFRKRLEGIEKFCRMTNLRYAQHLRASHIKPWRDSNDLERLDGNNGLLLSPHIDHLFDQGYLSFEDDGRVLLAACLPKSVVTLWNLGGRTNVGPFNGTQAAYLAYHRANIFRGS